MQIHIFFFLSPPVFIFYKYNSIYLTVLGTKTLFLKMNQYKIFYVSEVKYFSLMEAVLKKSKSAPTAVDIMEDSVELSSFFPNT